MRNRTTHAVTPAKAGVQNCLNYLDSGSRLRGGRNDELRLRQKAKVNDIDIIPARALKEKHAFFS
jgi:hypothetical protein